MFDKLFGKQENDVSTEVVEAKTKAINKTTKENMHKDDILIDVSGRELIVSELVNDHGELHYRVSIAAPGIRPSNVEVKVLNGTIKVKNTTVFRDFNVIREHDSGDKRNNVFVSECADSAVMSMCFSYFKINCSDRMNPRKTTLIVENGLVVLLIPFAGIVKEYEQELTIRPIENY